VLLLTRTDVEACLDVDRLAEALEQAFRDVSSGNASMPPRSGAFVAERDGLLGVMPVFVPGLNVLETKLVSVFPRNEDRPTHQAVIVCFDPANGSPVALLDAEYITAVRTAAATSVATRLLASPDTRVLTIVGAGVQAAAHARIVSRETRFEQILITSRDPERAKRLAKELGDDLELEVAAVADTRAAVAAGDVVCTTTHSPQPVVQREWFTPGALLNSVGVNQAGGEVDNATVRDALIVVESRGAALAPSPAGAKELIDALESGAIRREDIIELGEILAGEAQGRSSEDGLTLYKSVGIAAEDAAAAALVLDAAAATGRGSRFELG
jgi:ornithine cyclodeaminase